MKKRCLLQRYAAASVFMMSICLSACDSKGMSVRSITDGSGQEIWLDAGSEEMTEAYHAEELEFRSAIEEELETRNLEISFCHLGNNAAYMTGEFCWKGTDYCATWRDGEIISWVEAQPLESRQMIQP